MPTALRWCIVAALLPVTLFRHRASRPQGAEGDAAMGMPHDHTHSGSGLGYRGKIELEAEALQRDITEASMRNSAALEASRRQTVEVLSFEERSRETLRALMTDMERRDDDDCA